MSLILNIETSTTNCSVSISENEEIIASQEKNFEYYSHSEVLHVYIAELFSKSDLEINDFDDDLDDVGRIGDSVLFIDFIFFSWQRNS